MACVDIQNWGAAAPVFLIGFAVLSLLISFFVTIAIIWIYCKIFAKAGYSWAWGLLMLIPIVNIIMLCVLALGDWPVLQELHRLRQQAGAPPEIPGQAS